MAEEEKVTKKPSAIPFIVVLVAIASFLAGSYFTKSQYQKSQEAQVPTPTPVAQQPQEEKLVLGASEIAKIYENATLVKGNPEARVTIVEFSDFQCPACGGAAPAVEQILETFSGQVKVIFRHFPLSFHPLARPASLASLCAEEQGKFWEYHDKIFGNQQKLSDASLKEWAKELGMDRAKFNVCFDEKRYESKVDEDYSLGQEVGVNATPTFFVNGKKVQWKDQTEGWFNALKRYVEAELGR